MSTFAPDGIVLPLLWVIVRMVVGQGITDWRDKKRRRAAGAFWSCRIRRWGLAEPRFAGAMAWLIGQVAAATPALAAGVAAIVPGRRRACTIGGGAGNQQELRCYQADFPYFHDVVLYCFACPAAALKEPVKPGTQA